MFGFKGIGWRRWFGINVSSPSGYTYVGPCRCGFGPHAYYLDSSGRIVHAWQLYRWPVSQMPTKEDVVAEIEMLKKEKEELEKRIEELEKKLKEEEK